MSVPDYLPSKAETELVRFWNVVHAYLTAQANTHLVEAAVALGPRLSELIAIHNDLWERWIKPSETTVPELAGGTTWAERAKADGVMNPLTGEHEK